MYSNPTTVRTSTVRRMVELYSTGIQADRQTNKLYSIADAASVFKSPSYCSTSTVLVPVPVYVRTGSTGYVLSTSTRTLVLDVTRLRGLSLFFTFLRG